MVLCAIHDSDKTIPTAIVDISDDELFLKWPRYFIIRLEASENRIPVAAYERLNDWVTELSQDLTKTMPVGSVDQIGGTVVIGSLGGKELFEALGIHLSQYNAFEQQLSRNRKSLGDGNWVENSDPLPNRPRFLYRADSNELRDLARKYQVPKST